MFPAAAIYCNQVEALEETLNGLFKGTMFDMFAEDEGIPTYERTQPIPENCLIQATYVQPEHIMIDSSSTEEDRHVTGENWPTP